ncbi:beta strand repeat-containing protein [Albibacillus kandeliae]|uniref:beta strand repeat-containing protein n=1 Tax=Albibacillus kandeliae TaxID=2174228 RepID=UPI0018E4F8D7|nr:Ig-like domain-containing protein [Albibacillus kandeliae]
MSIEMRGAELSPGTQTILHLPDAGPLVVPDGFPLLGADFTRDGRDLVLHDPAHQGAADLRIPDYFRAGAPVDLQTGEGSILRAPLVERLAGPEAPGQYAQAGAPQGADPIGQVETLGGAASVQRSDGVTEPLGVGSKIFLNDVLQAGDGGKLSVTFVDGTIFTLAPGSRMVIDSLIYNPAGQGNSATFNLVQGGFVFIAGKVAETGGMDVTTPSATMGIRGTTVLVDVQTADGISTAEVTLTVDPDGHTGRVALYDLAGSLITTITQTDVKWIVSTAEGETREVPLSADDITSDTALMLDAVAAYQSAVSRFQSGGNFVELGNGNNGGTPDAPGLGDSGGEDNIDLDNQDQETAPEPTQPPAPAPTQDKTDQNLDEGRNTLPDEPGQKSIRLTGLEDLDEGSQIGGKLDVQEGTETITISTQPKNGSLEVDPDGSFSYVPDQDFNGIDAFTYFVTGPGGTVETGTVTINVLPVNDAPTIPDESVTVTEDNVYRGQAVASDVDSDVLEYALVSGAAHGSVLVAHDGVWLYTPDPDFSGTDSFLIAVTDDDGATAQQVVTVTVTGTPDAPLVTSTEADASGSVVENSAPTATGRLTASDPDGDALSWSGSATGTYGSFVIATDGTWTYTAGTGAEALAEGETVTESFTATVTDATGETATQSVTITLTGTGDGPVITSSAADARGAVVEDLSPTATGILTATDPDGGAVTWSGSASGTYGSFVITSGGTWTYTAGPAADVLSPGATATESFTATVTDGEGETATQIVTITLTGTGDGPIITSSAADARGAVTENTSPTATGTLTASDPEGGALTWSGTATGTYGSFVIAASGTWTYTAGTGAEALAAGETATETFTATVTDEDGETSFQIVTITLTGTNDAPVITSSNAAARGSVTENTAPTATGTLTASDADGDTLTWSGSATGTYGAFVMTSSGTWTYTAGTGAEALSTGETATETFTATVTDENGATATKVVTITITGANDGPVITSSAADARGSVTENTTPTASGTLAASDSDGDTLTWSGSATGTYGAFVMSSSGIWTYTAGTGAEALAAGETATETFTATVTDESGATATQVVTITLTGTNDAPVITSSNAAAKGSVTENTSPTATGTLTASDADGDTLTWSGSATGTYGAFVMATSGTWTYTAGTGAEALSTGETATETFTATVTDESGATATQVVTITLTGTNDAPVITSSNAAAKGAVTENTSPTATGTLTATDADGDALNWSGSATGTYGTFAITSGGSWSYTAGTAAEGLAAGETKTDSFVATVTDEAGATATKTVTITLTGTNDQPVVTSSTAAAKGSVTEDTAPGTGGTLTASDVDGDTLTWSGSASGTYGTFAIAASGVWTYTAGAGADALVEGQVVSESFTATVSDGASGSATQVVTVTITGTNDAPTVENLVLSVSKNSVISGQLPATDNEGDALTFAIGGDTPQHGSLSLTGEGTYSYQPDIGYTGTDSFSYLVTDSNGDSAEGTVTINVGASAAAASPRSTVTGLTLEGTEGNDRLIGADLDDSLSGGTGDDVLRGHAGDDLLAPGTGTDRVYGGRGDDRILLDSADLSASGAPERLDGGPGRDTLVVDFGGNLDRGMMDLVDLSGIEEIDMENGEANRLTLSLGDVLTLSDGGDRLLEGLLGADLPESVTVLGDSSDRLTLVAGEGATVVDTGTTVDMAGTELHVYQFSSGSEVLATLAADSDIAVTVANG